MVDILDHIVLVDIRSDGSIPDYQDIGWCQGIYDGWLVLECKGIITRYQIERVKRLVFLKECE